MSGDPDLATTAKAIQILDKLGADVIELGVPYSVSLGPQHTHLYTSMSPLQIPFSAQQPRRFSTECPVLVWPIWCVSAGLK